MKLNTAQLARTESQLQIEALPEEHPLVAQLNRIFGDHTYFLDGNGLNIVEPAAKAMDKPAANGGDAGPDDMGLSNMGVIVNLAYWTDSDPPKLEAHEPELTDSTVALGTDRGS